MLPDYFSHKDEPDYLIAALPKNYRQVKQAIEETHLFYTKKTFEDVRGKKINILLNLNNSNNQYLTAEDKDFLKRVHNRSPQAWISAEEMKSYEHKLWGQLRISYQRAIYVQTDAQLFQQAYAYGQRFLYIVLHLHSDLGYYYVHSVGRETIWKALNMQAKICESLGLFEEATRLWSHLLYLIDSEGWWIMPYQRSSIKDQQIVDLGQFPKILASLARLCLQANDKNNYMAIINKLEDIRPFYIPVGSINNSEEIKLAAINNVTKCYQDLIDESYP